MELGLSLSITGVPRGSVNLARAVRVMVIADSQAAGRGTGIDPVAMGGARALSWPTKLSNGLQAAGYAASSESLSEANNTGGTLDAYDTRCIMNTWTVHTNATIGGLLLKKVSTDGTTSFRFTPNIPVDTFEIWTPRNGFGTMTANVDGDAASTITIDESPTPSILMKTTLSTTLAAHQLRLGGAGVTGTVYLTTVIAYNSAAKDFRVINMGTRNWSTTDWIVADAPWKPLTSIATLTPDVVLIQLGVNDLRTGGAANSAATFKTNMQTIISAAVSAGAVPILVLPMPINPANEGSFTQAAMLTAYQELAATNVIDLFRTDTLLGTWAAANAAGQTSDDLHWKAEASATLGSALVPYVARAARTLALL